MMRIQRYYYSFYFSIVCFFTFLILLCDSSNNINECNTEVNMEFAFNYSKLLNLYGLDESNFYGLPYYGYISDYEKTTFQGLADHNPLKNVTDVKCGDIIFMRTDNIVDFFKLSHPKILHPYILITHNSDLPVGLPWHLKILDSPKILGWFGRNVVGRHPKLKMLPIGLYPHNYSIIHQASQNVKPFKERNLLLYLNFSPHTHPDRPYIKDYIKQKFWGEADVVIADNLTSWDIYLSNLNNAKFTVSPPGFGLDCYRTWEAAIMRTIPIVLRSEISSLYDGLPVMFVDSWTGITRKNLEKFERKYLKTYKNNGCPQDRPKIWARYWITKVMEFKRSSKVKFCSTRN